jgi:hypothetical protein
VVRGRAIEQTELTNRKSTLVVGYVEDEQNDDHVANARLIAAAGRAEGRI